MENGKNKKPAKEPEKEPEKSKKETPKQTEPVTPEKVSDQQTLDAVFLGRTHFCTNIFGIW